MSRIGKLPIPLSDKVEFSMDADNVVTVKGDKGSNSLQIHPNITVEKAGNEILVKRNSEAKQDRALHGLYRSLINNMVIGVTQGYTKKLEIIGVGFRSGKWRCARVKFRILPSYFLCSTSRNKKN